ncbi:MAG: YeeE/YedE family protein [Noviherbaspirillum sp.]
MQIFMALVAGLVFGIGLIVSGMSNPAKVIGFLDLAGKWDPSLALVMAGAIAASFIPFQLAARRSRAVLGEPMRPPTARGIDRRLVLGALAFGAGWGLAGYCPGPALASLLSGSAKPVVFIAAMIGGMLLFQLLDGLSQPRRLWLP